MYLIKGGNTNIDTVLPPFIFALLRKDREMKTIQFTNLEEVFDCYGRENLIAIDNLKQIIFYTGLGCQPKFVFENQVKPGKISAWFLKGETAFAYRKWCENAPNKNDG